MCRRNVRIQARGITSSHLYDLQNAVFYAARAQAEEVTGQFNYASREAAIQAAVEAEREACAEIAASTVCDEHLPTGIKIYGTRAAKAIRARGET